MCRTKRGLGLNNDLAPKSSSSCQNFHVHLILNIYTFTAITSRISSYDGRSYTATRLASSYTATRFASKLPLLDLILQSFASCISRYSCRHLPHPLVPPSICIQLPCCGLSPNIPSRWPCWGWENLSHDSCMSFSSALHFSEMSILTFFPVRI